MLFFFGGGLGFSSLICFFNLSCNQTYDSWRLGHVVPNDVVNADIKNQALDIFLHGPESAYKNGIGKTFTLTSIPFHTLLKQTKSKTLNSPNMTPSFSCPLPVQSAGGRRSGSLAPAPQDCSTSETLSPRTVRTENICTCVQHILQNFPTTMPFLTTSTITLSVLVTRTRGAWWCRYRGHCRSDFRHLSPRSRVCIQEWHCKDIHSHIHSHTSMHTHQKQQQQKQTKIANRSTHQTWHLRLLVHFLSTVLVGDGQEAWHLLLRTAPRRRPSRLGNICRCV